jgi:hypothetical protein
MKKYHRYINKDTPLDNEIIRSAVRFSLAIADNKTPNLEDQKIIAEAFFEIFGGKKEVELFGKNTHLRTQKTGRPHAHGYTIDEVISSHIEIMRRVLIRLKCSNPLVTAKKITASAFDFTGDTINIDRAINRHWAVSKEFVSNLDLRTLRSIINPYRKDKK